MDLCSYQTRLIKKILFKNVFYRKLITIETTTKIYFVVLASELLEFLVSSRLRLCKIRDIWRNFLFFEKIELPPLSTKIRKFVSSAQRIIANLRIS